MSKLFAIVLAALLCALPSSSSAVASFRAGESSIAQVSPQAPKPQTAQVMVFLNTRRCGDFLRVSDVQIGTVRALMATFILPDRGQLVTWPLHGFEIRHAYVVPEGTVGFLEPTPDVPTGAWALFLGPEQFAYAMSCFFPVSLSGDDDDDTE